MHVRICPVMMYGMADIDLGRRIRRAREAQRLNGEPWTQAYLASLLGVNVRTVGRWEREGTVPRGSLGALEKLFGFSLADDVDPEEIELSEILGRMQEMKILTAEEKERKLAEFRENKRRARGNGTAYRAS